MGDLLRSDTGSDCELELLCLLKEISSEVSRVEGCGDEDLGLFVSLESFMSHRSTHVVDLLLED